MHESSLPPGDTAGTHFSYRLIWPHSVAGRVKPVISYYRCWMIEMSVLIVYWFFVFVDRGLALL